MLVIVQQLVEWRANEGAREERWDHSVRCDGEGKKEGKRHGFPVVVSYAGCCAGRMLKLPKLQYLCTTHEVPAQRAEPRGGDLKKSIRHACSVAEGYKCDA